MPTVKRVSFICQDELNVKHTDEEHFETGIWKVPFDVARYAKQISLHASRAELSYLQGEILDYRGVDWEGARRYIFIVRRTALPQNWCGNASGEKGYCY
jgi:hypothetical protein